ncbi:MAG: exodeoxyribonuclease VII small subunit [Ruminococcus sp.]|nr:exodeoxyribonuclease VII small subunit [Ruminococcus sp.]
MTFEEKMTRLNEIVAMLEKDGLPLDKSLDFYREGIDLSVDCKKMLENAKLTVRTMNGEGEDEQKQ